MQGQSAETEEKRRGFASVMHQQCVAARAIFTRCGFGRYFHFDLNAGSGWNETVDVIGSPLLFVNTAKTLSVPYVMIATECDKERAKCLAQRTVDDTSSYVICGDNKEVVPLIPEIIRHHGEKPQYAIGTVLVDPNGNNPDHIPWSELATLFSVCTRLDLVFNYPATAMKRNRRHYVSIDDLPSRFQKKYWLIRHPLPRWGFTLAVGRNHRFQSHDKIRLYDWNSRGGIEARRKASLTLSELKTQGQLCLDM